MIGADETAVRALADTVDRRKLLVSLQLLQGALSIVLAAIVWNNADPSRAAIVGVVFAIGIANASVDKTWPVMNSIP